MLQSFLTTGKLLIPGKNEPKSTDKPPNPAGLLQTVEAYEKQIIFQALQQNNGNKSATAALLKITRRALTNKLEKYGIEYTPCATFNKSM